MPYYRRTYRRRTFRPRRMTRKRVYRRKYTRGGRRKINTNTYYFKRKTNFVYDWLNQVAISQLVQGATGAPTAYNIGFRLQDVPSYTDFTNVYDSYRIRAVKVNLIPIGNISSSNEPGALTGPPGNYAVRCFSAFDPNNDGVGITGSNPVQQIQQYQNSKWTPYNRIHKRYIKPKIMVSAAGPTPTNTYVNIAGKQPWNQCADLGARVHYGLPIVVDDSGFTAGSTTYKIECTYYMQFIRPK